MQSSVTVIFRALVMLSCLVAIPLAALFGGSLPDIVHALLNGRLPQFSTSASLASAGGTTDAVPLFEPMRLSDAGPSAAAEPIGRRRPAATPPPAVIPAGYEAPAHVTPPAGELPADVTSTGQVDTFTHIQHRLRALGATYYLLESWGDRRQLYRFYCKMAVGGNPNYTRYFEATDTAPLRAMANVLQQVEAWQAERE